MAAPGFTPAGNVDGPNRLGFFSPFKKKTPRNPDPISLQKKCDDVSGRRFSTVDNTPTSNTPISFFGKITRALKWSHSPAKTSTVNKTEGQRSRINSLTESIPIHTPPSIQRPSFLLSSSHNDAWEGSSPQKLAGNPSVFGETKREEALAKVKTDGMKLEHLSPEERGNEDIVKAAIHQNPLAFQFAQGNGLNTAMETLRKNPSLIRGRIEQRNRDGTMESKLFYIPTAVQVKFAILFLSQPPEQLEKDLPLIMHVSKGVHTQIAKERPDLLRYLPDTVQHEFFKTDENDENDHKNLLFHAREDIQQKLSTESPETYLRYANIDIQKDFITRNPQFFQSATDAAQTGVATEFPALLSAAKDEIQRNLADKQPNRYLKHVIPAIQGEIVKTSPEILTKNHSALLASLDGQVQREFLTDRPELLSNAAESIQRELVDDAVATNPLKYLQYADPQIQEAVITEKPHLFSYATDASQKKVASEWPKLLSFAKDEIQRRLATKNPDIYLQHTKKEIREDILQKNPSLCEYVDPYLQGEMAAKDPKTFLSFVHFDILLELLNTKGPSLLKYASEDAQIAYLNINPPYYRFASVELKAKDPEIITRGSTYLKVLEDGMNLQDCNEKYQQDPIIAIAAVHQNPNSFLFVKGQARSRAIIAIHQQIQKHKNPDHFFKGLDDTVKKSLIQSFPGQYRNI